MAEKKVNPDIQTTFNEQYKNFNDAFLRQFKDKTSVWLVLGNRGTPNYYRERFSKNWIFWDYHSSSDNIGISGDFLDPKNWKQVSELLPKKVNYIAADFNDLVSHPKRNNIIKAAKELLNSDGTFCIEDVYDNRKKQFQHFTDEDFGQLSKDFEIKYAYWDGYISSLPYTCDQSANKKSDMFKGLEMMILRLASANAKEKKQMLPCITSDLYFRSFIIEQDLVQELIKDIVNSTKLKHLIRTYEDDIEKEKELEGIIEKEKKETEALKKDIDNFTKMVGVTGNIKKGFETLSKNINAFYKGANYLTTARQKMAKFVSKNGDDSKDLQEKLEEKKNQLITRERSLVTLQNQLNMVKTDIKNDIDKILKYNDEIFFYFERDKYLRPYLSYKKEKLEEIIADSKDSEEEFWSEYDSFWNSISVTEILATELEKSWSPDVIIQNTTSLEKIRSDTEKKISDTSRIIILFIKK